MRWNKKPRVPLDSWCEGSVSLSNIQAKCYKTSSSLGRCYSCNAATFSAYVGYACLEQKLPTLQGGYFFGIIYLNFFLIAQKTLWCVVHFSFAQELLRKLENSSSAKALLPQNADVKLGTKGHPVCHILLIFVSLQTSIFPLIIL